VTGVLVTDATAGWHFMYNTAGPTNESSYTIPIAAGGAIAAGDALTVTLAGVTNPAAGTYTDFDVSTSTDDVPAAAPAYTISASGSAGVIVTPNPKTVGSLATYTITGLFATTAITGGLTGPSITLTAPAETIFPNSPGSYVITDSTTSSGSGTVNTIAYGSTTSTVTITPPNSIVSGDVLTITISAVINPSTASNSYMMLISGPVSGATGVAPFPRANVTYPNGALINFGGTVYVFAGGHPFAIPTPTVLNKIRAVDPAVPLTSSAVLPTSAPRVGTLLTTYAVNGNPTIYVVGTDGELHGFSTPKQLVSYGYDTRVNVTVNSLGGMTIGSTEAVLGAAKGNALATSSDGAIVDSSGSYYVFAGGRAFGIPTPAGLATIQAWLPATILTGTIASTQTSAAIANGVVLSDVATSPPTNYVSFSGNVFPFKTQNQLINDGYGGTAAIPVPNTGGLSIVTTYTGS
jgi:hypothetical protein